MPRFFPASVPRAHRGPLSGAPRCTGVACLPSPHGQAQHFSPPRQLWLLCVHSGASRRVTPDTHCLLRSQDPRWEKGQEGPEVMMSRDRLGQEEPEASGRARNLHAAGSLQAHVSSGKGLRKRLGMGRACTEQTHGRGIQKENSR